MKKTSIVLLLLAMCLLMGLTGCDAGVPAEQERVPAATGNIESGKPEREQVTVGGYKIDASLNDWSESDKENHVFIPVQNGQSARIYAKKISAGVIIAVEAEHYRFVTTSENEIGNSNFRFAFSAGENRYITSLYSNSGVSNYEISSGVTGSGGMRSTVFEIFVSSDSIKNFGSETEFGFILRLSGYEEDYFWGWSGQWGVDGCDLNNRNFTISEQGIVKQASQDSSIKIDGIADEVRWQSYERLSSPYLYDGNISARGFLGDDGVYLLLQSTHYEVNIHQYWCFNPNFEIQIGTALNNLKTYRVALYNGTETFTSANIGEAKMICTFDNDIGMYNTVCEVFIPYKNIIGADSDSGEVKIGMGFRSDEVVTEPFNPLMVNNESSWDMRALSLNKDGWKY